jgi:hypothetical protein
VRARVRARELHRTRKTVAVRRIVENASTCPIAAGRDPVVVVGRDHRAGLRSV